MSEINNYLNDESINDKQLVKELSVYVKNHNDKKLPINKKFVSDVINIILSNSEISFTNISFDYDGCGVSAWEPEHEELLFNITNILNNAEHYKKELKSNVGNNRIFSYFAILETTIHEITHARQDFIANDEKNNIYNTSAEYLYKDYEAYLENHDFILIERYANLRGFSLAYQVLSYVFPKKQIQEFRNIIYYFLLYGYTIEQNGEQYLADFWYDLEEDAKVGSAIDLYNEILESFSIDKVNVESNEELTLYDRLYLGLPITLDEFKGLRKAYYEMIKDDEKMEDVKKLINKL